VVLLAKYLRQIDLNSLRVNGPDYLAYDESLAINEERFRRSRDSEVAIGAANGRPDGIGAFDFSLKCPGGAIGVLYVHPYELNLAGHPLLGGSQHWRFLAAGYAPRGPEVDDQGRPLHLSEIDQIAVE